MPSKLNDPGWDDIFDEAGRQHNIDPLLLKAMMYAESLPSTDPVKRMFIQAPPTANSNGQRATGPMQLLPSSFPGVDPTDPLTSIPAAAGYVAKGRKQAETRAAALGVDPVTYALMHYHGGPDESIWGNRTRKVYPEMVNGYYRQLLASPNATPGWEPQVIFGDSLAQQANNHAKVGGGFKVGRNPSEVFDALAAYLANNDVSGKNVLLSSGISNAMKDLSAAIPFVEYQLTALKEAGANPVLYGVGPHPGLNGVDDQLKGLAEQFGATFVPLVGPFDRENIHPKNGRATLDAARAARLNR